MQSFLLVIQVLISISLIGLILIQHGKGADAGAAFGSGASSTVFGSTGSASFLSRATAVLATLFFAVALSLTILAHRQTDEENLVEKYKTPEASVVTTPAETPKSDVPAAAKPAESMSGDVPAAAKSTMSDSDVPVAPKAEVKPAMDEKGK